MGIPHHIDNEENADNKLIKDYVTLNKSIQEISDNRCRRMILVDGANLIHTAQRTGNKITDIKGESHKLNATATLVIVQKLLSEGFEVVIAMKEFFGDSNNSDNSFIFEELKQLEIIRFVDDQVDDDARLLRSAEFYGGAVVSRDKFSQIFYNNYKEGKNRRISFRFFKSEVPPEKYRLPQNKIDMFTELKFLNFEHAYATRDHPDFEKVQRVYNQYRKSDYHKQALELVNLLSEFLQFEYCKSGGYVCPVLPYYNTTLDCPRKFQDFKQHYLNYKQSKGRNVVNS